MRLLLWAFEDRVIDWIRVHFHHRWCVAFVADRQKVIIMSYHWSESTARERQQRLVNGGAVHTAVMRTWLALEWQ